MLNPPGLSGEPSALPIGRVMVVSFIFIYIFIRHAHIIDLKEAVRLAPCLMAYISGNERTLQIAKPATLHRKQGSAHYNIAYATSLYQRHGMCFDTIFISDMFYFLDGAKIRRFLETAKLFLRKIHFYVNIFTKNLFISIYLCIFAAKKTNIK